MRAATGQPHVSMRIALTIVVIVVLGLVAISCVVEDRPASSRVKRAIATAASGDVLPLAEFTDFAWSRLYVRPSRTGIVDLERELRVRFSSESAPREPIEEGAMFIFIDGGSVVYSFVLPTWVAGCNSCDRANGFDRSARFIVGGHCQGQPPRWIEPAQ